MTNAVKTTLIAGSVSIVSSAVVGWICYVKGVLVGSELLAADTKRRRLDSEQKSGAPEARA